MKHLTNYVAFICGLIAASIFFIALLQPVSANEPIDTREGELRTLWITQPDQREQTEKLYWDEMKRQVIEAEKRLPIQISKYQFTFEISMEGRTITYKYMVHPNAPEMNHDEYYEIVGERMCQNLGSQTFFEMMRGSKVFAYYRPSEPVPFDIYAFGPGLCKTNGV